MEAKTEPLPQVRDAHKPRCHSPSQPWPLHSFRGLACPLQTGALCWGRCAPPPPPATGRWRCAGTVLSQEDVRREDKDGPQDQGLSSPQRGRWRGEKSRSEPRLGAPRWRRAGKTGPQRGSGCEGGPRLCLRRQATTYLESFISICCRISCLSSSVLLGKMFRSSNSCLLGRFRSFTAKSSFLHFLGSVPESRRRDGREGTRTQVLVGCWLADLAAPLLLEGICTRVTMNGTQASF